MGLGFDAIRDDLNRLTSNNYEAVTVVLTRPPWGLGGLVALLYVVRFTFPRFAPLNVFRARVLARTPSGEIHQWVLVTDYIGVALPMTQGSFLGVVGRQTLRVHRAGLVVVRAQWNHEHGWVYRRSRDDFLAVANRTE